MKKSLLFLVLINTLLGYAQLQTINIDWQKFIGGNNDDFLSDLLETADGGYILAGHSFSGISGDKTLDSIGNGDYWVLKLSADAIIEWQETFGGDKKDILRSIQQTSDGGYILGGYSESGISGIKTENSRGGYDYWVIKLDINGNIEWQKTIGGSNEDRLSAVKQAADSGYILAGYTLSSISGDKTEASRGDVDYWIIKLNPVGNIVWQKTIGGSSLDLLMYNSELDVTTDGGCVIIGNSGSGISGEKTETSRGGGDYWMVKLSASGNIQWQKTMGGYDGDLPASVEQTYDGGYIVGGFSISDSSAEKTENSRGWVDYWVLKLDQTGVIQWQKTIGGSSYDNLLCVRQTVDSGYILSGNSLSGISGEKTEDSKGEEDIWIVKLNASGNIKWQKSIGGVNRDYLSTIRQTMDGNYIFGGYSNSSQSGDIVEINHGAVDYYILKLNVTPANSVSGKVFTAQNSNCLHELNEKALSNIIVNTKPRVYFALTDFTGKYSMLVDTGNYQISLNYPAAIRPLFENLACPELGFYPVSFSTYDNDTAGLNFSPFVKQCPVLSVEIQQSRLRRCFDNYAAIKYCNLGTADTNHVQVHLQLPEYVSLVSADKIYAQASDGHYIFDIGNLVVNQCGEINITDHVDCVEGITGLTQCIKVWITPDNICIDKSESTFHLWDKSEIGVSGKCASPYLRFVIFNTGENMSDSSNYRLYKDGVLAMTRKFRLNSGDSLVVNVASTPNTIRLEADQRPYHPGNSHPNATIQDCPRPASRVSASNLPMNDDDIDVEIHCLEIRDSYDPNDKNVSPSGVGNDKRVKHKVPLEYLIRFQNTGNDTAYKIVIIDTLDLNLDLSTLELGATSHPCKTEFTGSGRPILKFTFDPIKLVDSLTNEAKSHGFVSFKIMPYDSIPNGTVVKNYADIYFDFNLPIRTNTAQVTINDSLPTGAILNIITYVSNNIDDFEFIKVFPNPFSGSTTFEFENNSKADQLQVYDLSGKAIFTEVITHKKTYTLQRGAIPAGMYFYAVLDEQDAVIGRGKLIVQ